MSESKKPYEAAADDLQERQKQALEIVDKLKACIIAKANKSARAGEINGLASALQKIVAIETAIFDKRDSTNEAWDRLNELVIAIRDCSQDSPDFDEEEGTNNDD